MPSPRDLPEREPDELTLEDVAVLTQRTLDDVTRDVRRGRLPSRLVQGPRRGQRVVRREDLEASNLIRPSRADAVLEAFGVRVVQQVDALEPHEVAVVLDGLTVNEVLGRIEIDELPTVPGRMRVPVSALLDALVARGQVIAGLVLLRFAAGQLSVTQPPSPTTRMQGHAEVLRTLL